MGFGPQTLARHAVRGISQARRLGSFQRPVPAAGEPRAVARKPCRDHGGTDVLATRFANEAGADHAILRPCAVQLTPDRAALHQVLDEAGGLGATARIAFRRGHTLQANLDDFARCLEMERIAIDHMGDARDVSTAGKNRCDSDGCNEQSGDQAHEVVSFESKLSIE